MSGSLAHANELAATVVEAARRHGDRVAIVAPGGVSLTYIELDRRSDHAAAWLQRRGLQPGQLLALCLPSSADHLVLQVGAAKAGIACAGINPRLTDAERDVALDVLGAELVVGTVELLPTFADRTEAIEVVDEPGGALAWLPPADSTPVGPDPSRPVAVVLTSGTEGRPKAAVFEDRQLTAIRRLEVGDAWGGAGAMLVSTELCHVGIATKLVWYLRLGATLHLLRRWQAREALEVIESARIASVGGISSQFALLLRDPTFADRDLRHVTQLVAGGGPSSPALVDEARRRFGAGYSIRYSSTESGGLGCATDPAGPEEEVLHTVGRPRRGVEVRIGDDGIVWMRSAAVMARYHHAPELTASTLVDGWLRTQDLGEFDDEGRLRLRGRTGDSWVRGGHNVDPETVEAVLSTHPLVAEVAVVPRPDDVMGHIGVAVVVPRDPARMPDLDGLRDHAGRLLARHELPEDLVLTTQLPRNATDKIDRARLRQGG